MRVPEEPFRDIAAISFDFGNTLVPVGRAALRSVVEQTAAGVSRRCGPFDRETFLAVWDEERARQFAEEIPRAREPNLDQRIARVLARLRGLPPPPITVPWDDDVVAGRSEPSEIAEACAIYSAAFVDALPPSPVIGPFLERLAGRYSLGVLSNWPLAAAIDTYLAAAGWAPYFRAVVVSERVGTIKPELGMFRAMEAVLGIAGAVILHVGDDFAADVLGARRAGWRTAWLRNRPADSPLPMGELPAAEQDAAAAPVPADAELDDLLDLEAVLGG